MPDEIPFPATPEAAKAPETPEERREPIPEATPFYSPEIVLARARASRRRAAAMCFDTDLILGVELRAMSPATHSMLVATGNTFLAGGQLTPGDVREYVWFHHPRFKAEDAECKKEVMAEWARAVFRANGKPWWKGRTEHRQAHGYAKAIQRIKEIVEETFADAPSPRDENRDNVPVGASLEAQVIHTFCRTYGWSAEYIRGQPLRKLYQYLRVLRSEHGAQDMDREEAQLMFEHLSAMNRAAQAKAS